MICSNSTRAALAALGLWACGLAGCSQSDKPAGAHSHDKKAEKALDERKDQEVHRDRKDAEPGGAAKPSAKEAAEIAAERAKLSPEDRVLVEAQEWCAITTDERLGAMGPPLKVEIGGKPVFLCCKGCKKKAESEPEKTLAAVEELKAKKKAETEAK